MLIVVLALTPLAKASPLWAVPVLLTVLLALVFAVAVVLPAGPPPALAPPAALTEPVLADASLLPFCPVPLALPVLAWADPVLLTVVTLFTVTTAELLAPLPIEPPVATLPPLSLFTATVDVLPVALTLPLTPLPLLVVELEALMLLLAWVPLPVDVGAAAPLLLLAAGAPPLEEPEPLLEGLPEPDALLPEPLNGLLAVEAAPAGLPLMAPPAPETEPVEAAAAVLPFWPVPAALPLVPAAWPEVLTPVLLLVFEATFDLVGNWPLPPLLLPPVGPPAMEPPVANGPDASTLDPVKRSAKHTEPVVTALSRHSLLRLVLGAFPASGRRRGCRMR